MHDDVEAELYAELARVAGEELEAEALARARRSLDVRPGVVREAVDVLEHLKLDKVGRVALAIVKVAADEHCFDVVAEYVAAIGFDHSRLQHIEHTPELLVHRLAVGRVYLELAGGRAAKNAQHFALNARLADVERVQIADRDGRKDRRRLADQIDRGHNLVAEICHERCVANLNNNNNNNNKKTETGIFVGIAWHGSKFFCSHLI